jgi:hypothetical protein
MFQSKSPTGDPVDVPETSAENGQSFELNELSEAFAHFRREGFALIRGAIPQDLCAGVHARLISDVKSYKGTIPRINGANEVHRFNEHGHVVNALMNVQRTPPRAS